MSTPTNVLHLTMAADQLDDLRELIAGMSSTDLDRPSVCRGWRVRDVIAHVCSASDLQLHRLAGDLARAWLRPNRALLQSAITYADAHDSRDLDADLSALADRYRSAHRNRSGRLVRPGELLVDYIVHTSDVACSADRPMSLPNARVVTALDVAPSIGGLMRCKQRVRGLHLTATDVAWEHGEGTPVAGSALTLLVAMTGRQHASRDLHGAGAAVLRAR
ncbi:MAG: hypothetical protein QOD92_1503 [Acidimicrobiaceae bacterium]|jgi:uncharacterized protein (TIGR03083 family)